MVTVSGDLQLAEFRSRLTGRFGVELVQQHGGSVLVQLPVGVGKSRWIDAITLDAVESGAYDLVIVLAPTRQLIEERGPLQNPPRGVRVVNLRPRPVERCGPERDARWRQLESADLGVLGRVEVCGSCPLRARCFWPGQYGQGLREARIIYATQAHLERSPGFLLNLRAWTGAERVLTLLDESNFAGVSFERTIQVEELQRFIAALRHASRWCETPSWRHPVWLDLAVMLQEASTSDLQARSWRTPFINPRWAAVVQSSGLQLSGDKFRFLGYDLMQFVASPTESRRKAENGDIQFSIRPFVGDCLIFSGTADLEFARFRLGKDLASPFADHRFIHPETRWYNAASSIGTKGFFRRHAPQILDFFAELLARRLGEGKRVLLAAKKCFVPLCLEELEKRCVALGLEVRFLTENWSEETLKDPRTVPLINYGMIGTNLFEHFDAVYCLTGFYVNEEVVNQCLQDLTRQDLRLPIKIETIGNPKRRRAGVVDPDHRFYDTAGFVQPALEFQEHNVVVQAVGRVRPFTRPREVITFQMAELPGVRYDTEFKSLAEMRRFFGISCTRERKFKDRAAMVHSLRQSGLSQAEIASRLGVTERTVRNYEKSRTGNQPFRSIFLDASFPVVQDHNPTEDRKPTI